MKLAALALRVLLEVAVLIDLAVVVSMRHRHRHVEQHSRLQPRWDLHRHHAAQSPHWKRHAALHALRHLHLHHLHRYHLSNARRVLALFLHSAHACARPGDLHFGGVRPMRLLAEARASQLCTALVRRRQRRRQLEDGGTEEHGEGDHDGHAEHEPGRGGMDWSTSLRGLHLLVDDWAATLPHELVGNVEAAPSLLWTDLAVRECLLRVFLGVGAFLGIFSGRCRRCIYGYCANLSPLTHTQELTPSLPPSLTRPASQPASQCEG